MKPTSRVVLGLAHSGLLALAWWALSPGLSGSFLFDDFVNLSALGDYGGVRDWPSLALYLTSGLGDPFGRPLALLSFLIDARTWPAQAHSFLSTNIVLHLINGTLLGLVLLQLGRAQVRARRHSDLAAVFGAGMWLLHPLFLSTTLYVVQREAMLAATFTLLGFLAWLAGRRLLLAGRVSTGHVLLFAGAIVCTGLAALCKANGVLVPLLLLVAEATVLNGGDLSADPRFVRTRRVLIGVPLLALVVALAWVLPQSIESTAVSRPWSIAQRLLTEPRVLLDYIGSLVLPKPIGRGVFHDDFPVSTDWLHPASTLPALAVVVFAVAVAWRFRQRAPVAAFSVLFFFAAHALESSIVPLELYFEHRNYLPALFAFWPLAAWLWNPRAPLRAVRIAASCAIVAGLAVDTRVGARIWGEPEQLAHAWAASNPDSPRAQAYVAQYEMANGANALAVSRLEQALARHPDEAQLAFNLIDARCNLGDVPPDLVAKAQAAVSRDAKAGGLDFSWLSRAIDRTSANSCTGLDMPAIESILQSARANPRFAQAPGRIQDFEHVQGLIRLAGNEPEQALAAFDHAVAASPEPAIALRQAALLGNAGRPDLGLQHLDGYVSKHPLPNPGFGLSPAALHAWLLDHYGYWRGEFSRMRDLLAQESHSTAR